MTSTEELIAICKSYAKAKSGGERKKARLHLESMRAAVQKLKVELRAARRLAEHRRHSASEFDRLEQETANIKSEMLRLAAMVSEKMNYIGQLQRDNERISHQLKACVAERKRVLTGG